MAEPRKVVMVVTAAIEDRDAYGRYMEALVSSDLFAAFGATPLATGAVWRPLEGDYAADEITALVEFPSLEAAEAFWRSDDYRRIAALRQGAGRFRVGLWRKFPPARA